MKKIGFIVVALLLLSVPAFAQKIAYVDLQRALNQSKAGAAAKQQITELVQKYEVDFKKRQDDVLRVKSDLEKQAPLLSDAARAERERDFQRQVTELQRFQQDVQQELQIKDSEHTSRIINEMFTVLDTLGKEGKYALIFEKNEGAIVYGDPALDLTDALIKAYDARQ